MIIPLISIASVLFCCIEIALYLLYSLGLFRMAKRLNIKNPWFSFVPVLSQNLNGRISDTVACAHSKKPFFAFLLPALFAVKAVFLSAAETIFTKNVINIVWQAMRNKIDLLEVSNFAGFKAVILPFVLAVLFGIAYRVVRLVSLYKIYGKFNPQNKTVYTVLDVFLSFLTPIFVFTSSRKEIIGEQ